MLYVTPVGLPQCPGGGQIKTRATSETSALAHYHSAPVGARSKQRDDSYWYTLFITTVPRWGPDQNAVTGDAGTDVILPQCPGGGQIKTGIEPLTIGPKITTVPRWGPDQNPHITFVLRTYALPQCPGGGQIKTWAAEEDSLAADYHSAPVGARSKRTSDCNKPRASITTVPRWGPDQNRPPPRIRPAAALPQCPGGGQIKTRSRWKQASAGDYHSAPVGARSKPGTSSRHILTKITTVPRWGPDQNGQRVRAGHGARLPQCPGGGQIKTEMGEQDSPEFHYHSAPVGARSKPGGEILEQAAAITTVPRWGPDQNWLG